MTVIMVTRLQLNLKGAHKKQQGIDADSSLNFASGHLRRPIADSSTESAAFFSVGNLGEEIEDPMSEDTRKGTRRRDRAIELRALPQIV